MRGLPVLVAGLITAGATLPAVAQPPPKVTVSRWAYVYVTPHVRLEPLAQIEPGVELPVLGAEGDWYLIEYTSPRWGKRRGYIHRSNVQTVKDRPKGGTQSSAAAATPPRPPAVATSPTVPAAASTLVSPDEATARKRLELQALAGAIAAFRIAPGTSRKIMIFGGRGHGTYLGCLSCPSSAPDSIFNAYGGYGRCASHADRNLFCRGAFAEFGSSGPFDDASACSSGASDPPVIVDEQGAYYGRFSVGEVFGHNDSVCSAFSHFNNRQGCETVKWVCQKQEGF
jgi:hypothetical protein